MNDERTPAQRMLAWIFMFRVARDRGWSYVTGWLFRAPNGVEHDLSAVNPECLHILEAFQP